MAARSDPQAKAKLVFAGASCPRLGSLCSGLGKQLEALGSNKPRALRRVQGCKVQEPRTLKHQDAGELGALLSTREGRGCDNILVLDRCGPQQREVILL